MLKIYTWIKKNYSWLFNILRNNIFKNYKYFCISRLFGMRFAIYSTYIYIHIYIYVLNRVWKASHTKKHRPKSRVLLRSILIVALNVCWAEIKFSMCNVYVCVCVCSCSFTCVLLRDNHMIYTRSDKQRQTKPYTYKQFAYICRYVYIIALVIKHPRDIENKDRASAMQQRQAS